MSKVIKDSPRVESEEYNVIEKMEEEWPEMTKEFKKIQREQYELFFINNTIMGQEILVSELSYKLKKKYNYHLQVYGLG